MVNPPPTPKTNAAEAAVQRRRLPDDRVHFTAAVKCNLVAKVDRLGGVRVKVDEHECVSATVTSSGGAVRVRANQRVRCLKTFFFSATKKNTWIGITPEIARTNQHPTKFGITAYPPPPTINNNKCPKNHGASVHRAEIRINLKIIIMAGDLPTTPRARHRPPSSSTAGLRRSWAVGSHSATSQAAGHDRRGLRADRNPPRSGSAAPSPQRLRGTI